MRFLDPIWLGVAAGLLGTGILGAWSLPWRRRRRLRGLGVGAEGADLWVAPDPGRERLKWAAMVGTLVFLCVALARPVGDLRPGVETERKSLKMMVAVDVSNSMLAEDGGEQSRLERAGEAVRALLEEAAGDEVGMVVFRGGAARVSPPTRDLAALKRVTELLSPRLMGEEGSSFENALDLLLGEMDLEPGETGVVWVLSDGEWHSGSPEIHARNVALSGVRLVMAGVGDVAGSTIPMEKVNGREGVLKHRGQTVRTRLEEASLRRMAEASGGRYLRLNEKEDLADLYREAFEPLRTVRMSDNPEDYQSHAWIPLFLALCLCALEWGLPWRVRVPRGVAGWMLVLACVWGVPGEGLRAAERVEDSIEAIQVLWDAGSMDKAYEKARGTLRRFPGEPAALYNYGLAAYRRGEWEVAALAWEQVRNDFPAFHPDRVALQIGNARVRLSQERSPSALDVKEMDLRGAFEGHRTAAELGYQGAERNAGLSARLLADVRWRQGQRSLEEAGTEQAERIPEASVQRTLGRLLEGVAALDEAHELDQSREDIREARERARNRLGDFQEGLARRRAREGEQRMEEGRMQEGLDRLTEAVAFAEEALQTAPSEEREALADDLRERENQARRETGDRWMDEAAEQFEEGRSPAQSLDQFERGLEQLETAVGDPEQAPAEDRQALNERREQLADYREEYGDQLQERAEDAAPARKADMQEAALENYQQAREQLEQAGAPEGEQDRLEEKVEQAQDRLNEALMENAQALMEQAAAQQEAGQLEQALATVDEAVGELTRAQEEAEGVQAMMEQAFAKRNEIQAGIPVPDDKLGTDPGEEGEGVGLAGKPPLEPEFALPPPPDSTAQEHSRADSKRSGDEKNW